MILFIDGTCREESRSRMLAEYYLNKRNEEIIRLKLSNENILPLNEESLAKRNDLISKEDFNDEIFKYAKLLKEADTLVIATPYYDLSFSANIKAFIEAINIVGYTFAYDEKDMPYSLCHIKDLYYFTTAGGPIISDEYGFGYVKTMFKEFYEVKDFYYIKAEMLDIVGQDPIAILDKTKKQIDELK